MNIGRGDAGFRRHGDIGFIVVGLRPLRGLQQGTGVGDHLFRIFPYQ